MKFIQTSSDFFLTPVKLPSRSDKMGFIIPFFSVETTIFDLHFLIGEGINS